MTDMQQGSRMGCLVRARQGVVPIIVSTGALGLGRK